MNIREVKHDLYFSHEQQKFNFCCLPLGIRTQKWEVLCLLWMWDFLYFYKGLFLEFYKVAKERQARVCRISKQTCINILYFTLVYIIIYDNNTRQGYNIFCSFSKENLDVLHRWQHIIKNVPFFQRWCSSSTIHLYLPLAVLITLVHFWFYHNYSLVFSTLENYYFKLKLIYLQTKCLITVNQFLMQN